MIPNADHPHRVDEDRQITATTLFEAFSNERRQHTVAYLAQKPAAISLGDLAEYLAICEGEPTADRYDRVLTALAHNHLPHLQDAGMVHYDATEETVELAVSRRIVEPYLDLAGHSDA